MAGFNLDFNIQIDVYQNFAQWIANNPLYINVDAQLYYFSRYSYQGTHISAQVRVKVDRTKPMQYLMHCAVLPYVPGDNIYQLVQCQWVHRGFYNEYWQCDSIQVDAASGLYNPSLP